MSTPFSAYLLHMATVLEREHPDEPGPIERLRELLPRVDCELSFRFALCYAFTWDPWRKSESLDAMVQRAEAFGGQENAGPGDELTRVRVALGCEEGDDAEQKALDGVAKRIGLLDDLAEQTSIVDEMVRSAARGSLAGDYARGWTCAVDEVKRRMASILARRHPTAPELPVGRFVDDVAPRPERKGEYQMMVEHIAANPQHVSVAPGRRDGALISCVTCGYVPRNDLSAFAPKIESFEQFKETFGAFEVEPTVPPSVVEFFEPMIAGESKPPRFHCDETDNLCALLQAWGATNVTGDYVTGELRWTSATANMRCYIGPERTTPDAPWGFSASAIDLHTDEPRVAHPCIRPTRELAIADAEALVDLMVAARPS